MNDRRVIYVPPDDQALEKLAKAVCTQLAAGGDQHYVDPQVVFGLSDVLKFTAGLLVKYLNAGHDELLDKHNA